MIASLLLAAAVGAPAPLALHPDNPRYFLFRGKPTVLVTSGEHYGAVLNLDFDYVRYLDALAADGLNLTRTFSGVYREIPGNFGITDNTLAPLPGRFVAPWARSTTPGESDGGTKFDLARWDEAYFRRLVDFVAEARRRGIVVEMNLFCPFYEQSMWDASPMNAKNNVNGVGAVPREEVYTLKHADLTRVQEEVARRIVTALNPFDNLYFEVANEPYFGGITMEWQHHVAKVIAATEASLPNRHLVSMNVANGRARVESTEPARLDLQLPLHAPAGRRGDERSRARRHRRERDRLPRQGRRPLPDRGLGLPHGRRRALQQPRLLVHAEAPGRDVPRLHVSRAAGTRRSGSR